MAGERAKVTRNIRMIYVVRATGFLSGILLVPIMIQSLGIDDFGLWILATAVFGYSGLLELGISGAVTKFVAQHRGEENAGELQRTVNSALSVTLLGGAIALAALSLLALFGGPLFKLQPDQLNKYEAVVGLLAVRALFAFPLSIPEAILKGYERYDLTSLVAGLAYLLTFVSIIGLLRAGAGLIEVTMVSILVPCVAGAANSAFAGRVAPSLAFGLSRHPFRQSKELFRYAAAGLVVSITTVAMYQADFFVVGVFLSTAAVGVYAVVAKFNQVVRELDWLTLQSVVPLASRLNSSGDGKRSRDLLLLGTRYLTAFEYPLVATLIVFAGPALAVWIGPSIGQWTWLVQVFLSYSLLIPSVNVAGYMLMGHGTMKPVVRAVLLTAILNVALSIVGTLLLGSIAGVVIGTVVAALATYPYWLFAFSRGLDIGAAALFRASLPSYLLAGVSFIVGSVFLYFVQGPLSLPLLLVGLSAAYLSALLTFMFVILKNPERGMLATELLGRRVAALVFRGG